MFKLLRFYSIASFISIFITAALLTLFYREVTIHWISQLAEKSNTALAQTALNSIRPALMRYLDAEASATPQGAAPQKFPAELAAAIENVMRDTPVIRFKIYNRNGVVAFASNPSQIGTDQSRNAGFMAAIGGTLASSLIYRDRFNPFDKVTEEDNLLQTYIPVRSGRAGPTLGVFEIYTDVNQMVHENERSLFIILLGGELIMATLFVTLVLVVRRANQHLDRQQQGIRKRAATLEILSNRLLDSDEQEKKKIAFELHEGLAQTLAAIKANVENSRFLSGTGNENAKALESIVPVIQGAIQEVRSIATELRPSSLDDLGLTPTINWFCREFERLHPGIQVELALPDTDEKIPAALKIVIYRIIESAFENIAEHAHTHWIQLALRIENDSVTLKISGAPEDLPARQEPRPDLQLRFAEEQERTLLSSGIFSATQDLIGTITLTSSWPIQGMA
ncbi:MAG: histidine kinase [Sulfuricella sp.]